MCIEWKDNKSVICKSGDLLLTGRSERRFAQRGGPDYIQSTLTTDYCAGGHIIYKNNALKRILNPEGYVTKQSNGTSNYYYYAKDHLGNNRAVFGTATPTTFGGPQQEINYYPFGMPFYAMGILGGYSTGTQPYKFGDKEYDEMHGLNWYDFGARYYSGIILVFMSMDPLCEKYYSVSPYAYCLNNPVRYVDPTGKDVRVRRLEDGTYEVVGGTANDDLNIYTVDADGNRTDDIIGQSLTAYSFHNEDGVAINGVIINPFDNSGADFLNNEIIEGNPSMPDYMLNATGGKALDFKRRGINDVPEDQQVQHMYHGMPLNEATSIVGSDGKGTVVYGSARDVGNVAAGYVAGRKGLTWQEARIGFDTLETLQHMPTLKIWTEGQPTQRAQRVGLGQWQWKIFDG